MSGNDIVKKSIQNVIYDKMHGSEFYNEKMIEDLQIALKLIIAELNISDYEPQNIIRAVNNYVKVNVSMRKEYFKDYKDEEKIYRTAYGALVSGEAMCAGYAEAVRMLLDVYGIEAYTILAKLPEEHKKLMHYVCIAKLEDNEYVVVDPEREYSCERRGIDKDEYFAKMKYVIPTEDFIDNKLINNGVGPLVSEYLQNESVKVIEMNELQSIEKYILENVIECEKVG